MYMEYTDGIPSPEIYRLWSGIACLSGVLERRVCAETAQEEVYPNLYVMFVANPAVGKSKALARCTELWREFDQRNRDARIQALHVAPDNVTKASLVDNLGKAERPDGDAKLTIGKISLTGLATPPTYHSLLVASSELGVFIYRNDLEFLSLITHIYDNPPSYREDRRTMEGRQADISKPQLVFLSAATPDFLATILPETAWGQGFMSRIIMVYAGEPVKVPLFGKRHDRSEIRIKLLAHIERLLALRGKFKWSQEAANEMDAWHQADLQPQLKHNKLLHYNNRRLVHMIKLCIISSVSRSDDMIITLEDYKRAQKWLLDVELEMENIFAAMHTKSDTDLLNDLHVHIWRIWRSETPDERNPVREEVVYEFLRTRVPSERISKIIEIAEKSGMLSHAIGGGWLPRPMDPARSEANEQETSVDSGG